MEAGFDGVNNDDPVVLEEKVQQLQAVSRGSLDRNLPVQQLLKLSGGLNADAIIAQERVAQPQYQSIGRYGSLLISSISWCSGS